MELSEEGKWVIIQLFFDDSCIEEGKIHPKKKEKKKGALTKELQQLIHDYKENELDIDLEPYQEAESFLRKMQGEIPYQEFIDSLLIPYMN